MLEIQNLHASVLDIENSEILKGVDLKINKGEVHAIWVLMDLVKVP
ncbi:MAG: hypothetical protein Ct9H300mP19_17990 [Dehalococcoidia bacterium]|nr:MAG: hypothetical protein Ct9H300mP19_17990 [Dehalococcoidia bacterium]